MLLFILIESLTVLYYDICIICKGGLSYEETTKKNWSDAFGIFISSRKSVDTASTLHMKQSFCVNVSETYFSLY